MLDAGNQDCMWCAANLARVRDPSVGYTVILLKLCGGRNVRIFKNVIKDPREIVEEIKVMSWRWSVHPLKISPCLLYEWMQLPRYCFR
ncbi:pantothenate synthetase, partial [Trifolium pratense]